MKNIIIALLIAVIGTNVAFAATVISVKNKMGTITTPDQTTEIYSFNDMNNGVQCYFAYIKGNKNTPPVMSCVKVK